MITFKQDETNLTVSDIYLDGSFIGWFQWETENSIKIIMLSKPYRGKGLLSKIYAAIERDNNITLCPSRTILSAAVWHYWNKRKANLTKTHYDKGYAERIGA
jgi:hypothetical protein